MIESLMLCGIGLLVGCLLMLAFFPLIHERAVRLTRRQIAEATPMTVNEIQANKDHLRAEFAMSVRRLEISMEEMREKSASRYGNIHKQNAEISRLQVELDKRMALIFALRTREQVRKSVVRMVVKILLYFFIRASRRRRPPLSQPVQGLSLRHGQQTERRELAAAAAAIAALNLKRRRAAASKF
jgi:hypothetical protein